MTFLITNWIDAESKAHLNADDISYDELKPRLRARFWSTDQGEKFQMELRARRRDRDDYCKHGMPISGD